MSDSPVTARFIDSAARRVFLLARRPASAPHATVLIAAPFAEEMNKSRRMLSEAARALAARGVASVLPDLSGTGDSSGEFANADWEEWRADLLAAARWSAGEGWPVTALLGVRTGCILAAQAARELPQALERTVFWQPVTDGERFLNQFLRLRVAASMIDGGADTAAALRERLARGEPLEVSGYELAPRLAGQLAALRLVDAVDSTLGQLHWIEVVRSAQSVLAAASESAVEAMRNAGVSVTTSTVQAEPFWSSTEIVAVPELVARTVDALVPGA